MKKSDLKLGQILKFNCNANLGAKHSYGDYYSIKIYEKPSLDYGESYPQTNKDSKSLWKVVHIGGNNYAGKDYNHRIESIDLPGYILEVITLRVLDIVEDEEVKTQVDLTDRQRKAVRLRRSIKDKEKQIQSLNLKIQKLEQDVEQDIFTANALERYGSDEEALAAMLAEVMKSGGDQEKIQEILRRTGVTSKL